MPICTVIAVDFDTKRVDRNARPIWESRAFGVDEEEAARAFLVEKQRTVIAALSKRMTVVEGRWFRVAWVADSGRVICESEGFL